jgi:hypothetical protein
LRRSPAAGAALALLLALPAAAQDTATVAAGARCVLLGTGYREA